MLAKKSFLLFIICIFIPHLLIAAPSTTSYHISEDMHTFSTNYPRSENSQAERESLRYITDTLNELGVPHSRTSLESFNDFHSFSSLIEASFPGAHSDNLYLFFPLNHPIDAAQEESGAAGLALALDLCRALKETPPPLNVHIVFAGAEFGRSPDYQLGSRAFLENLVDRESAALVYVDLSSLPNGLELQPSGTGRVAPAWFVRHSADTLQAEEIPYHFSSIAMNIYRLGINEESTRIDPFLKTELPAIYLYDSEDTESAEQPIGIEQMSNFFLSYIESFPTPIPQQWDRHYIFFKWGSLQLLLTELAYVLILLLLFALVLLYPFFQRKHFRRYVRSIRRHSWVLPVLFLLMFLYLLLSTFLLEGLSRLQGNPLLWRESPFLMLLLKVGFAAFLFSISHRITRPFHFNRLRGSFYSASGLLFLLIDVVLLATINLSLTIYSAVIFLLGFLFTLAKSKQYKLIYLLLSIVFVVAVLLQMFRTGSSRAMYAVLLSHVSGNMIISFHFLPYMLFTLRLRVLFHRPGEARRSRYSHMFELLSGLLSAGLILYFAFFYYDFREKIIPLEIREELNQQQSQHMVQIESVRGIPPLEFSSYTGERIEIPEETQRQKSFAIQLPLEKDRLEYQVDNRQFLGRSTYTVRLSAEIPPEELEISLLSDQGVALYDSDYPFSILHGRKEIRFHIGRFPSFPFRFRFTIPREMEGSLQIRAWYYSPQNDLELDTSRYAVDYRLEINEELGLPPLE